MFRVRSGSYRLVVWFLGGWCWWLVLATLLGVSGDHMLVIFRLVFVGFECGWYLLVYVGIGGRGR